MTIVKLLVVALVALALPLTEAQGKDVFDDSTQPPGGVISDFKKRKGIKDTWKPNFQVVSNGAKSFEIDGEDIYFDDLVPHSNLYTPDAKMVRDDGSTTEAIPYIHHSKTYPNVRVILDDRGRLVRASSYRPDGSIVDLLHVKSNFYAQVEEQVDMEFPAEEEIDRGSLIPSRTRYLRNSVQRNTQTVKSDCSTLAQLTVFVASDSDFAEDALAECDICTFDTGNRYGAAKAAIEVVFEAVQNLYREQLCIDLKLKGTHIVTDPSKDPYRKLRLESDGICSGSSLVDKLSYHLYYVNDPSNGDRGVFHLFFSGSTDRTRGCAWVNGICDSYFGVGVSEVGWKGLYSDNLSTKRNVVAHEIGHNLNAVHTAVGDGLMSPAIDENLESFSGSSRDAILKCLNGQPCTTSCLKYVANDSSPTPSSVKPTVNRLVLRNVGGSTDIEDLQNGKTYDLNKWPSISVRAETSSTADISSVFFYLNGQLLHTESTAPYYIQGDNNPWLVSPGTYTISVVAKSNSGVNSDPLAVTVTFAKSTPKPTQSPVSITPTFGVQQLMLVDAGKDQDIGVLQNGKSYDLSKWSSISIRADTFSTNTDIYSVTFFLDGQEVKTERKVPYVISGDSSGDYNPWAVSPGTYTISAEAASVGGATSERLSLTVTFGAGAPAPTTKPPTLAPVKPPTPRPTPSPLIFTGDRVVKLVLSTATQTQQDLRDLKNGDTINLSAVGPISIRADTYPTQVGSVLWYVNGQLKQTENKLPYTIAGDDTSAGTYNPYSFSKGTYTIKATPFSGSRGSGDEGQSLTVSVTFT